MINAIIGKTLFCYHMYWEKTPQKINKTFKWRQKFQNHLNQINGFLTRKELFETNEM